MFVCKNVLLLREGNVVFCFVLATYAHYHHHHHIAPHVACFFFSFVVKKDIPVWNVDRVGHSRFPVSRRTPHHGTSNFISSNMGGESSDHDNVLIMLGFNFL